MQTKWWERPEYGTPSAYYIKGETRAIKELARQFATQSGDPGFLRLLDRAFDAEAATVAKRGRQRLPVKHKLVFLYIGMGIYPGPSETRNHDATLPQPIGKGSLVGYL